MFLTKVIALSAISLAISLCSSQPITESPSSDGTKVPSAFLVCNFNIALNASIRVTASFNLSSVNIPLARPSFIDWTSSSLSL